MMFNRCSVLPTETAGYKTNGKWYWFGEQPFLKVNSRLKILMQTELVTSTTEVQT